MRNLPNDWINLNNGTNSCITVDYILPVYPGTSGTIFVRRLNQCGYSIFYSVFVEFDPWCGYYRISPNPITNNITVDGKNQKKNIREKQMIDKYTISPNPATDHVIIDGQKKNIREIQIMDNIGRVRKIARFGDNQQRVNLNISGLIPGIYYIKIFDGKEWRSKPLIVQ